MLCIFMKICHFPIRTSTSSRRQLHDLFEAPQWHGDEEAEWPWSAVQCKLYPLSLSKCVTCSLSQPSGSIAAVKMDSGET